MRKMRWALALTTASWVTRTSVWPCSRFRRTRRSMIWADVSESRFPVGSSAHTIAGSVAGARRDRPRTRERSRDRVGGRADREPGLGDVGPDHGPPRAPESGTGPDARPRDP